MRGHLALEDEVRQRDRDGRDEHEPGQAGDVGLSLHEAANLAELPASRRWRLSRATGRAAQGEGQSGGQSHETRAEGDERLGRQGAGGDAGQTRPEGGSQ